MNKKNIGIAWNSEGDDKSLDSKDNNTSSKTKNQIIDFETNKFSDMIFQLIEHTIKPDISTELYADFSNRLDIYFRRLINKRKTFSILNSYFLENDDNDEVDNKNTASIKYEKIKSKVNKNIMIYLPVLAEYCRMNWNWENDLIYRNFINQAFKKLLILLFIYWDKTKLSLFSKLLFIDFDTLKEREQLFIRNQLFLQDKEEKLRKKIQDSWVQITSISDLYTRTYRSILEKTDEKFYFHDKKSKWIWLNRYDIRNNIAINEITLTTKALYELYVKALDLWVNLKDKLLEISNAFVLLNWLIEAFKELWIINDSNYKLWCTIKNDKNLFHEFLKINWDIKKLDYFIFVISSIDNKNNLSTNNDEESKTNEVDVSKLTLKNIDSWSWKVMSSDQKYSFFLEKVLKVWNKSIDLSFFKNKKNKKFLNDFSTRYNYPIDMYTEIINSKNNSRSFSDLLTYDINVLIYLFEFFDFIISEWNPIKIDLIYETLNNKWSKSIVKMKGDSYNLSAVNIWLQIDFIFKDLSRWNINLKEYKIWNNLFSDTVKLYSPWEKASIEKSISYLDNAIDTCIMILNLKRTFNSEQSSYINLLIKLWIIPNDLSNIKQIHLDNIIKLIPWLKLVKLKIWVLKKMLEVSKTDSYSVSDIFSRVWLKYWKDVMDFRLVNSIWPEKDFWRIVVKLIKEYSWDFHRIWDLNRFKLVWSLNQDSDDNIFNMIRLLSSLNVSNNSIITFQNYLWHLLWKPEKKAWYRWINLNLMLPSWNLVEIQLHITEMLLAKSWEAQIDKNFREVLDSHWYLLTSHEVEEFVRIYYDLYNKYLPKETIINLSTKLSEDIKEKETWDWILNCDILYKLNRSLDAKNPLKEKLTKLERALFDFYWSKVVASKLKSLWIEYK